MSVQSEHLLRAIGEIDESLVRDAAPLESLPQKRPRRKVFWLAAAAALAVLLSGTALAAANGVFGIWAVPVQKDEGYYRQALSASVKYFTAEDFGPNILASPNGLPMWSVKLDSLHEAEEYLGYPIIQNPLLDGGDSLPGQAKYDLRVNYEGLVGSSLNPADFRQVYLSSACVIDGISVVLTATFATEHQSQGYPNGFPLAEGYAAQERTLPNGVKAVLILPPEDTVPSSTAYRTHPVAYFVYEGACYELFMWGAQAMQGQPENPSALDWEGVFYRVLDAFE